jgi:hypothetical protein
MFLYYIHIILGLTPIQIADILNIPRKSMYSLDENRFVDQQFRIKRLYDVSMLWANKDLGRIGRYLHNPVGENKESLFDLLKKKEWDMDFIQSILDEIAVIKTAKKDSSGTPDYSRLGSIDFL